MIREVMARPQEIAWLPWAVQYFFSSVWHVAALPLRPGYAGVQRLRHLGWSWLPFRWRW